MPAACSMCWCSGLLCHHSHTCIIMRVVLHALITCLHVLLCAQYNTYSTHYRETDCIREMLEPFLYNTGVDIVLHGG